MMEYSPARLVRANCVWLACVTVMLLGVFDQARAETERYPGSPAEGYADPMVAKLSRGLVNVLTGIGEIPRQIIRTSQDDGILQGSTAGVLKGVFMATIRTTVGAIESCLFMVPAPGHYDPMLDPALVWQERMQYYVPEPND